MEERTLARNLTELEALFDFIQSFAPRHRVADRVIASMSLAAEELFTNILRYNSSGRRPIVVGALVEGGQFKIVITDPDAPDFDPTAYRPPDMQGTLQDRFVGGLGLHLVQQIVDDLAYEYHDRQSRITLIKNME
jgi:anti-sigma regulatory factor (Ser/Thr protein kinase)